MQYTVGTCTIQAYNLAFVCVTTGSYSTKKHTRAVYDD